MYVVLSKAEKNVPYGELIGPAECLTLQTRCRTNLRRYNKVKLHLIQSLVLLTDINKVFVNVIITESVTVNFCTRYNETSIHCSHIYRFPTIIVHFFWSQKLPISTIYNFVGCIIPQSVIVACKLFLILSHGSQYSQKDCV